MSATDYALMLIAMVALSGLIVFVWERYLNPPLIKKYDGQGAWAKNSSKIPWYAWLLSPAVLALFLFGPTVAARIIG
ncbi:hypothetical protein [Pusillimonas minor]|uniref:Uncharacterized protein n=1 Tax=Pusillimonas minor TaxID=2697024 RepID=A0A842HKW5_9BURK|nr:hypothetical protein [Pusillimonas minor]MBC2768584.1 hypothetical protein [Pusillimonas minor]